MVWSPLSNLLLYGQTAQIGEFHDQGVAIGLGSDWSPSGSKNLLGELKVAYQYNRNQSGGSIFSAEDLVRMVTSEAAAILDWSTALGSIEPGKLADLMVIDSTNRYYHQALIDATERDVILVMVGGTICAGRPDLLPTGEAVTVGGEIRHLDFQTPVPTPGWRRSRSPGPPRRSPTRSTTCPSSPPHRRRASTGQRWPPGAG